ncbi:unnamed protein product [Alternaria alternata]
MAVGGTTTMIQAHGHRITVKTPLSPPEASTANDDELPPTAPQTDVSLHIHSVQLLNPESITSEFDKLRFEAAAHDQLVFHNPQFYQLADDASKHSTPNRHPETLSTLLISSPIQYPQPLSRPLLPSPNYTLPSSRTSPDSAQTGYPNLRYRAERYEWKETSFYVVVFRSQLKEDIDQEWLYRLDEESHREACESGGLLKYWFGKGDEERRNLATCFWHSREDAYKGGLGPWHKKARAAGRELYESIVFSTYQLIIKDGAEEYGFEDYKG